MVRVAAASRAYGRSLRLRASSQAHYGVDEDEEWWPGRVLGLHSQGAHTVASTTTASSSSNANRNPYKLTLTLILTRTLTRILTLTRRARAL